MPELIFQSNPFFNPLLKFKKREAKWGVIVEILLYLELYIPSEMGSRRGDESPLTWSSVNLPIAISIPAVNTLISIRIEIGDRILHVCADRYSPESIPRRIIPRLKRTSSDLYRKRHVVTIFISKLPIRIITLTRIAAS